MNSGTTMLAVYKPLPQWLNFLAMFLVVLLVAFGILLWAVKFRKRRRRKYHRRRDHRGELKLNPTLAEVGGLPPPRTPENPSDPSPLP